MILLCTSVIAKWPCFYLTKVVVVTGDNDDSGFDGSVYITVTGSDGSSSETKLDPTLLAPGSSLSADYKPFGKSSSDAFALKMADVGQINYALVRIEATGSQTSWRVWRSVGQYGWLTQPRIISGFTKPHGSLQTSPMHHHRFLNRIELTNSSTGAVTVLSYKSSLNTDWNSSTYVYPQSTYSFTARIITMDVDGAAFDGDVYITPSNWWSSGNAEIQLDLGQVKMLDRGSCIEAQVKTKDVSWISSLGVRIVSVCSVKCVGIVSVWM